MNCMSEFKHSFLTFRNGMDSMVATKEWCVVDLYTMDISLYFFRLYSSTGVNCGSIEDEKLDGYCYDTQICACTKDNREAFL